MKKTGKFLGIVKVFYVLILFFCISCGNNEIKKKFLCNAKIKYNSIIKFKIPKSEYQEIFDQKINNKINKELKLNYYFSTFLHLVIDMNTLLEECIEALNNPIVVEENLREQLLEKFNSLKFGTYTIDWKFYPIHQEITNYNELRTNNLIEDYYIIWGGESPILQTQLGIILDNIDDVVAVDFDTWLISTSLSTLIEFHHEGSGIA